MTPEQQRIAIAQACGWICADDGFWDSPSQKIGIAEHLLHTAIPDYLNDLNAMHEAEKTTLKNDALLWHKYASFLDMDYCNQPYTIGSTARQRAEAFLKTLNLWKQ